MPGTISTVAVTAGVGTLMEVITDAGSRQHPVGVVEFVDAINTPILVSPATPLPITPPVSTPYTYISAASAGQDAQVVKNGPAVVSYVAAGNQGATARFLKIYDKASAPASTDTPVMVLTLPAGGGNNPHFFYPVNCLVGVAFRITQFVAFNDATAAAAGDVNVNIGTR